MDFITYEKILDFILLCREKKILSVVLVFKLDAQSDNEDCPDMVISPSDDPEVITALLGNRQEKGK